MRVFRFGIAATVVAALGVFEVAPDRAAAIPFTKQEEKCAGTLAKSFSKLQATVIKAKSRCHNDDISGKADSADNCETLSVDAVAKIDKAKDKFVAKVAKACSSVCGNSNDVVCVHDLSCPARHVASPANNNIAETCAGKDGQNAFTIDHLDWPGPYCEAILGHPIRSPEDIGNCVNELVEITADAVDQTVYAELDETSGLSSDAAKCLSSISKSVTKSLGTAYGKTAVCRNERRSANSSNLLQFGCPVQDEDSIAALDKALDGIANAVEKKCDNVAIAALAGLCATGGESPATVADAQACLSAMVEEVAVGERSYNRHVYAPIGMLNITHPGSAAAYCGDGLVNPWREEHTGVGEECDGENDAACGAGSCIPKGDIFECTCDNVPRERFIVDGDEAATDSDAGWLGTSHEATHNDGFGYVTELSNCTCDVFSQATCTTPSGDDVCDFVGNLAPRCSDDLSGTDTCDDRGDGDGFPEDSDCFLCDDNSINAGAWCSDSNEDANETVCQSQCVDNLTGLPVMPQTACQNQEGCAAGSTCRGRCETTLTCNRMTEGSPLPLISASTAVCIRLEYLTDVTGSKNIVTGETEVHYTTRSLIALGITSAAPCPVCGGVCLGGPENGSPCFGRCNASNATCLFDTDCTGMGDTTCLETADDCTGGACSLDLRCSEGTNRGGLCRPDAETSFGTVSHDCPGIINANISGTGVLQPFGTVTTEAVQFPAGSPCTDSSWINFDCPCPADSLSNTGVPSKPSDCAAACDGGVNAGKGCVTGNGGAGEYTTCVGVGGDAGKPCDADSDCDSNNCSDQPRECTAGTTSLLGTACAINTDCGGGGLCEDSCPGARCVPLCIEEGRCNGGARDGDVCATLDHCKQCTAGNPLLIGNPCDTHGRCNTTLVSGDGFCEAVLGVTCDLADPEDGYCASGPTKYWCNGAAFTTVPCELNYGTCTSGTCQRGSPSKHDLPCVVGSDCLDSPNVPVSSGCELGNDTRAGTSDDIPGAGECEPRPRSCFVNNGFAEGGDTLNGGGSPSEVNINAAFCTPANANPSVNSASGFGGPSRVRRQGAAIVNVPSIP